METPPGRTRVPASASARISSRVNQRASSISEPSTSMVVSTARAGEADHQAGRQRPRLAAEVGHLPHLDAGLLLDLATDGVLHRLAGLHEAGERGVAALRPQRAASEQGPLVGAAGLAVGDDHDHGGVGPRELVAAAVVAVQHVPGLPGLERAAAPRAVARRPEPLGEPDRVQHQRPVVDRLVGQRLHHRAQHHPLVAVAGRVLRVDDHREVLDAVAFAEQHPQPVGRLLRARPRRGDRRPDAPARRRSPAPASPGRPTARRASARRCAAARGGRGRAATARRAAAAAASRSPRLPRFGPLSSQAVNARRSKGRPRKSVDQVGGVLRAARAPGSCRGSGARPPARTGRRGRTR